MEKITRWFSVTGGVTRLDLDTTQVAGGEAFRLRMSTELFRAKRQQPVFKQEETAVVSDRGLESFEIVETAEGFKSNTKGTRQGDTLTVTVKSDGVEGSLKFDLKAFDISTYELLLLERSDLSELSQEPFLLFDPEDLEIYIARLSSRGQVLKVNGSSVKVQNMILNVEGEEFQMTMTQDGELLRLGSRDFNAKLATARQARERRQDLISRTA